MAAGDYKNYKDLYTDKTSDVNLLAASGGLDNVVVVKSASHQLWIQKISYNPVVAAAQLVTFQDDAGTRIAIGTIPANQSTALVLDFGPKGVPLTVGMNLDIAGTAGPAAKVHIEAYEKLGAVISYLAGASLQ